MYHFGVQFYEPDFGDFEVFLVKVIVHACYGAHFVVHVFKYLVPNFVSRRHA